MYELAPEKPLTEKIELRKKLAAIVNQQLITFHAFDFDIYLGRIGIRKVIDLSEFDFSVENHKFTKELYWPICKTFLEKQGFTKETSTFLQTYPK